MSETVILNEPLKAMSTTSNAQNPLKAYKDFENDKLRTDSQIFLTEAERLRSYQHQIKEMRAMIYNYKTVAIQKHRELEDEMAKLNLERQQQERAIQEAKKGRAIDDAKILGIKKKYLELCKERVGIANTINTELFKKLEMEERKSESHELFKWIIVTFYKEPVSKYYWENFNEQVFKEDKGHDFKERIGKISAAEMKEEERVSTEALLKNRQKYIDHPDLASVKEEVKKLVKIGDLVMMGNELTKELAQEEKNIELKQVDTRSKEELAQKCVLKSNATKERIDLSDKYIETLEDVDQSLARKESIYSLAASEGHKIIQDLRSSQPKFLRAIQTPIVTQEYPPNTSNGATTSHNETVGQKPSQPKTPLQPQPNEIPPLTQPGQYNTSTEKRDECNCTLF